MTDTNGTCRLSPRPEIVHGINSDNGDTSDNASDTMPECSASQGPATHVAIVFWRLRDEHKVIVMAIQDDLERLAEALPYQLQEDVHEQIYDMETRFFCRASVSFSGYAMSDNVRIMEALRDEAKQLKKRVDEAAEQAQSQANGVNGY